LLRELLDSARSVHSVNQKTNGIRALNGASGAGQSYVLERVETLLKKRLRYYMKESKKKILILRYLAGQRFIWIL
ncbi:MAG: hypothetical protein ACC630_07625, partial [Nitrospinota bacterium]